MRPVRLTMQAFGPYPGREVVDFDRAVDGGLFGIYGPTGSGKSTIFSAMTFALFGEAAKAEQETTSLRSDHADPNMPTEVEFVFDVGERRYVARRSPEQMRPKYRGGGETRSPHEAWLFDATGLAVDQISNGNSGKMLAEKKTGAVREAVTDLLGYGPEQFRQIVLLPQGRFETFLAAKTDERVKILRELFDVSTYRRLAAKFKEDADAAEREVREKRGACAARIKAEGFDGVEALADGIEQARGQHREALKHEAEAAKAVDEARTAVEAGRKLEALFVAAAKADEELKALLEQESGIVALEARVRSARRAQALVDVENHLVNANSEAGDLGDKLRDAEGLAAKAAREAVAAAEVLRRQRAREHEIGDLRKLCDDLERYQQQLIGAAGLEANAKVAAGAVREAQKKFGAADRHHADLLGQTRSQDAALKVAREKESVRGTHNRALDALKATLKDAEQFEKAETALATAKLKAGRLKTELDEAASSADEKKAHYEVAEANLATVQALHLAAKLHPGEACPVCGSFDHPAPANGKIENLGRNQAFLDAKAAWEEAQRDREEAARNFASAEGAAKASQESFDQLSKPENSSALLREKIAAVTGEIAKLGPVYDLDAAERRLEKVTADGVAAETARETARDALDRVNQEEGIARAKYEQAQSAIPEEFREWKALDAAQAAKQAELAARQAALAEAVNAERAAGEAALRAGKDADAAKTACVEAIGRRDKAEAAFTERLEASGLTESLYQSFKAWIPTIDADSETVNEFRRKLDLARTNGETAGQAISGSVRPDLAPLATALEVAEQTQRLETDRRAGVGARLSHLEKLRGEIERSLAQLQEYEERTAPLRDLAALFNAENDMRLDLETFAIGAMFDHVLCAANQRLGPMTNSRYLLARDDGVGGRSRRGLGIRVFDFHTGKPRSPPTLSGGETFIAALALALGLSDVVESVNGRVHLDTIFIDEGFGSLDTENESGTLVQVLQVLTDLVGQRRSVGLISHVQLVQEAIPNGFYVRKELRGSRIEARAGV